MGPCILWKQLQDSVSLWDMAVEDRFVAPSNSWLYAYKLTMCIWYNMYNVYQEATTLTLCAYWRCIQNPDWRHFRHSPTRFFWMHRLEFTSVALAKKVISLMQPNTPNTTGQTWPENGQIERTISRMKPRNFANHHWASPISCSARSPQNGDIFGCGGATRRLQGADYVFVATQGHRKWSPFVDGEGGEDPHLPILWPISPWVNPLFGSIWGNLYGILV